MLRAGLIVTAGACWLLAAACTGSPLPPAAPATATEPAAAAGSLPVGGTMRLESTAFTEGNAIPRQYTCDGENISPPLAWSDVPANAQSLALIADDPDAPSGTFAHWVLFNLPATTAGLAEARPAAQQTLDNGATQGTNSFRRSGYGGPCPPSGTHRYYFKLYALDTPLKLKSAATAKEVQDAMKRHILAEAHLMGHYQRTK